MSSHSPETSAKLFRCPTCGASLDVVDAPSVTCKYCGNNVPVPASLRPQKPHMLQPQVVIQAPTLDYSQVTEQYSQAIRGSQRIGCIIAVVILLVVGGITAVVLLTTQNALREVGIDTGEIGQALGIQTGSSFAELTLEFGGKGTGAGLFDDPRYIAVDPDGNIFVADYDTGRVQKFDPSGKFDMLINVEPDSNGNNIINGMATDYAGSLYVSRGGDILIYSTEGGRATGGIPGEFPDTYFEAIAVDASNTLYVLHSSAGEDDLLKLSPDGEVLERWVGIVSGVNKDDAAINLSLAVDGAGHPYIASGLGNQVYIYDAEGKFVDRFGEEGTGPGQLTSPNAIAVDGQNRVYVSTFGRVDVFDRNGKYIDKLPFDYTKGVAFGISVDLKGDVYVVTNAGKVLKFKHKTQ